MRINKSVTTCSVSPLRAAVLAMVLCSCLSVEAQIGMQDPRLTGQDPRVLPMTPVPLDNSHTIVDRPGSNNEDKSLQNERALPLTPGAPMKPEPPSEFQNFIFVTTGQKLPMFGYDLFEGVPATFAPVERIPVTADYVIGPGDELLIRGWGQVDIDHRATVDRLGNIFIPKVGTVNVAGTRYGQLEGYLKTAIGRVFQNFDLNVTMGQLRSIQIFVVGQARRPGSYTVSSLSSLVNAIFACGGISQRGSLRHIQLKRDGKLVTELDLYDLLIHGDKTKDVRLQPGDVIYVPPIGKVAALTGSVNQPAIYEVKEGETLGNVIEFGGRLSPTASGNTAVIERIKDRTIRALEEVKLDDAGLKLAMQDGDLVTIRSLSARYENAVTLRGNVANPGRFPWHPGMRIKDLIPNRDALVTRDYWLFASDMGTPTDKGQWGSAAQLKERENLGQTEQTELKQTNDKEQPGSLSTELPALNPSDTLINSQPDPRLNPSTNRPESALGRVTSVRTQLSRGVAEVNWNYAVIQRFDLNGLTSKLVPFNLGKAVLENDPDNNLPLEAGDIVTIFSQDDIRISSENQVKYVRLEGEFQTPGIYQVKPGETLRQLVGRAGGLSQKAYLYGSEFLRESTRKSQQKQLDLFLQRLDQEVERTASIRSQNVVSPEEAVALKDKVESQRKLVDKLRLIRASGRVVLGITATSQTVDDLPDIPLEDGDIFQVPYRPGAVNVIGAVYNDNSYVYYPGRTVSYYLAQAGSGTKDADKGHIVIVRADGSVSSKNRPTGWFGGGNERLMPGDTVVVPEKLEKIGLIKELKDYSLILSQFGLGAAAIITLTR